MYSCSCGKITKKMRPLSTFVFSTILIVLVFAATFTHQGTVPEIIRSKGYICEEHHVTTEDGYILTLHRIPHGNNVSQSHSRDRPKTPVLMQHGLFSSSGAWVLNLTRKSAAFLVADAGYDVWLTNVRGNLYSKNHTHLNPKSKEFWSFSWDEMAKYDVPAFIDYILNQTNQEQLFYIGHSMGTTIFYAGMSVNPEYNDKIKAMFGLAPVATVAYAKTLIAYFSYLQKPIEFVLERTGNYEILPHNSIVAKLVRNYCDLMFLTSNIICENLLFMLIGFDGSEFDPSWMPNIMDDLLSGTSLGTLTHFSQEFVEGRFQFYDYGYIENYRRYYQMEPPEYRIEKVTAPVHLIWSQNDYLADEKDVQFLIHKLPNVVKKWVVPYKKFNHLDFLWAKDMKTLLYDPVLEEMKKIK